MVLPYSRGDTKYPDSNHGTVIFAVDNGVQVMAVLLPCTSNPPDKNWIRVFISPKVKTDITGI